MQSGGQSANHVKRYVSRLSTLFYGLMYCVGVRETGKIELEKRWLSSAKVSAVWVHRTVSGVPDWLWRTHRSREWINGVRLKFTGLSGEPTVGRANGRPGQRSAARSARDTWPSQRSEGGTRLSGVHRTVSGAPTAPKYQRSASPNKERDPHRTVSGAPGDRRQDLPSNNALNGS
jgi:hypothetical protein